MNAIWKRKHKEQFTVTTKATFRLLTAKGQELDHIGRLLVDHPRHRIHGETDQSYRTCLIATVIPLIGDCKHARPSDAQCVKLITQITGITRGVSFGNEPVSMTEPWERGPLSGFWESELELLKRMKRLLEMAL